MADKTLTCRDCGNTFTFTEGEQDFYSQKGYSEPAGSVQQQLGSGGNDGHRVAASTVSKTDSNSTLPFTGLDIALVVAAGGVLLAMGLGIRRLSRTEVA